MCTPCSVHVARWIPGKHSSRDETPSLYPVQGLAQFPHQCSKMPLEAVDRSSQHLLHGVCPMQVLASGACRQDDPGPGCACKLEELATSGACPAGYQCAPQSELGRTTNDSAQGSAISVGICIPCSLGQYCPRGAVLPHPGSPEASQYVTKYSCRPATPPLFMHPLGWLNARALSKSLPSRVMLPVAEM